VDAPAGPVAGRRAVGLIGEAMPVPLNAAINAAHSSADM
jgi:hypothetical protein